VVVDDDLGRSGASAQGRKGFSDLVADVGLGKAGIVLSLESSRRARNNSDWYQLLDLCALTDTLIADADGVYHPGLFNDRLVLGLKGTMSEALCRIRHRASYADSAVMPTMRRRRAAGRAGGRERSA
jgi:DNA invertase Pin-like site-specific DNA recombinase